MPATPSTTRRTRVLRVASLLAGAAAVVACSSTEPPPAAEEATTSAPPIELHPEDGVLRATVRGTATDQPDDELPGDVLLVGDSVLVLVADELASRVPSTLIVDAADCRRIDAAITGPCGGVPGGMTVSSGLSAVVDARSAEAAAPGAAVIVMANNSTVTRGDVDAMMDATAGIDHVWWVNARLIGFGRQDLNNQVLADLISQNPRAGLVDWHGESEGQDWLADNVHPNEEGQAALATLIADRLRCGCTA